MRSKHSQFQAPMHSCTVSLGSKGTQEKTGLLVPMLFSLINFNSIQQWASASRNILVDSQTWHSPRTFLLLLSYTTSTEHVTIHEHVTIQHHQHSHKTLAPPSHHINTHKQAFLRVLFPILSHLLSVYPQSLLFSNPLQSFKFSLKRHY
jgi:hypothetical protein